MRIPLRTWQLLVFAGLVLFALNACAGRQTAAPTMTDSSPAEQTAVETEEEALEGQPASEEQRRQEEADRRQFEAERNRFVYEDVFFGKNKYRLNASAKRELEWKTDWLRNYPDIKVLIEGHCDEGGRPEDNLALGARRAGEVKSFFLRRGIEGERLSVISYGKERPLSTGESEEERAKNRRVRTIIIEE